MSGDKRMRRTDGPPDWLGWALLVVLVGLVGGLLWVAAWGFMLVGAMK